MWASRERPKSSEMKVSPDVKRPLSALLAIVVRRSLLFIVSRKSILGSKECFAMVRLVEWALQ